MEQEIENNKPRRKLVSAVTLPSELQERVVAIAEEKEWSLAQTGGWLIRKGFEKLDEENAVAPREMAVAA